MFCQSCGQKNIDEARFCNFCGDRIAAPGAPGGRTDVAPSASRSVSEQWGPSMTLGDSLAMSLAGLGIKTPGRAYGLIAALALALMGVGGAAVYLLARGGEAPSADSGHASPGDTFLVGAPIPEGLELPPYPEEAPNAPDEPRPAPSTQSAGDGRSEPPRPAQTRTRPPSAPAPTPAPTPAPAPAPAPELAPAAPEKPPSPPPSEPATTPPPKNPEAEMELELYAGRVRFAVSRYYAGATQSCFDKATQRDATLSGTVVIATKVGADGQVKSATPTRNSTGDQSLGECLASQVRSFRLPPPPNGEIELKLPFSR
jgi:outer membrane biosynthesis protein TonB